MDNSRRWTEPPRGALDRARAAYARARLARGVRGVRPRGRATAPLEAEDLELLADGRAHARPRRRGGRDPRARAPSLPRARRDALRAVRAATWIGMNLAYPRGGRRRRAAGWHARSGCSTGSRGNRSSTATCCSRPCSATRRRATSRRPRPSRARQRRSASASATAISSRWPARPGPHARPGGPRPRRPRAPRRGDGDGDDERPLAVRRRHRLLRRHPRLPGGLRGRPRAGVDARADAVGRAAARPRRLHRPLPRPSRRDPAARRLVVGRPRGGAAAPAGVSSRRRTPRPGSRYYRQAELLRLRGEFAAAEEAYREASRLGWEPQPGLAQLRLAQGKRDAALAAIRRASGGDRRAAEAGGAASRVCRDRARRGRGRGSAGGLSRAARSSPRATRARCSRRMVAHVARCGRARRRRPHAALVEPARGAADLARARRAVRGRADTRAPRAGVLRARRRGGGSARAGGRLRDLPAARGRARPGARSSPRRAATRTACPAGSSRYCASSPPGRATARSPRRS